MITAKRPALRRLYLIDRELHAQRYPSADKLAALAEVNHQTIRRDLDYLRDQLHAPVSFNHAKNGWEYTEPTYRLPAVIITEGELLAMFLAGQSLRQAQGAPYEADLQRALRKLTELLPEEISVHWDTIEQAHSFHQTVTTLQDIDTFRRLADAVLQRKQLRLRYWTASREEETERVVDPWHLASINGDWYLIGWCHERQARRMFAPGRIRELTETGAAFTVPEDFHIAEFFDGTFKVVTDNTAPLQTVRLRFAPSAAKYIREKVWHVSQTLQSDPDGGVTITLQLRSLIEVRRFVMSWGSECTVIQPAELREDIRQEAAAILEQTAAAVVEHIPSRTQRTVQQRKQTG